jgi:hypothetical protein
MGRVPCQTPVNGVWVTTIPSNTLLDPFTRRAPPNFGLGRGGAASGIVEALTIWTPGLKVGTCVNGEPAGPPKPPPGANVPALAGQARTLSCTRCVRKAGISVCVVKQVVYKPLHPPAPLVCVANCTACGADPERTTASPTHPALAWS